MNDFLLICMWLNIKKKIVKLNLKTCIKTTRCKRQTQLIICGAAVMRCVGCGGTVRYGTVRERWCSLRNDLQLGSYLPRFFSSFSSYEKTGLFILFIHFLYMIKILLIQPSAQPFQPLHLFYVHIWTH